MKIFMWKELFPANSEKLELNEFFSKGSGITVGSFDGLHKGHRLLLKTLVSQSEYDNLLKGVVTFTRPLPSIKHSSDYSGDISTLNQRMTLFESFGIDFVIIVDFDNSFAALSGTEFFIKLIQVCNLKLISEGIDFRCGYKGATDVQAIKYFAQQNNIKTFFVDPVYYQPGTDEEERVSSSYIRSMIKKGFFATVEELLERKYQLDLSDKKFEGRTSANKEDFEQVLPSSGTYHCKNEKEDDVKIVINSNSIIWTSPSKFITF